MCAQMHPLSTGIVHYKNETQETVVKIFKLSYIWTIKNFSQLETDYQEVSSHQFSAVGNKHVNWSLKLSTSGMENEYISLFLQMNTTQKTQVRGKFKFALLNEEGLEVKPQWHMAHNFEPQEAVGFLNFVHKSCLRSVIIDDTLKVLCEVRYAENCFNFPTQKQRLQPKECISELSQHFEILLESQQFCDVTLFVAGTEFRAHKNILAARSSVFAAMFQHDMQERRTNYVCINGIEPQVFKELLQFIYTGKAPLAEQNVCGLLAAADIYAVAKLKFLCELHLSENIRIDTSLDILFFADKHSAEHLKSQTIEFIGRHIADLNTTQGWKNLQEARPDLVNEIQAAIAKRFSRKCKFCGRI